MLTNCRFRRRYLLPTVKAVHARSPSLRSGQALAPLVRTRGFGMTPVSVGRAHYLRLDLNRFWLSAPNALLKIHRNVPPHLDGKNDRRRQQQGSNRDMGHG
jgi:hypothetical protein